MYSTSSVYQRKLDFSGLIKSMGRKALISKHVALTTRTNNIAYAVVLVEDENIHSIVEVEPETPVATLMEQFREWNPIDYSECYLLPGQLDLNARREFESYTQLTQAAISGGVTFILEEDAYYLPSPPAGELFCDVGKVVTIDANSLLEKDSIRERGCLALKAYLYPPSYLVTAIISDTDEILTFASELGLPLLIDPNIPDPRVHFTVSPTRLEPLERRFNLKEPPANSVLFAAAFPEEIGNSDDKATPRMVHGISTADDIVLTANLTPLPKVTKGRSDNTAPNIVSLLRAQQNSQIAHTRPNSHTVGLLDDLEYRIEQQKHELDILSLAEESTYSVSGRTTFVNQQDDSPTRYTPNTPVLAVPLKKGRPPPITVIVKETPVQETIYNFHIANYPATWEVKGIMNVLESLQKIPCQVHICDISSAPAFNEISKIKKKFPLLTCEIPAVHLFFTSEDVADKETRFKNNVVVKNSANCNLVWDLLKYAVIDSISSQHASIDSLYKASSSGDFSCALNGINTMGFSLPAIWTRINGSGGSLEVLDLYISRMTKWMSVNPAKIIGVHEKRGSIEEGKYADIVVWNPFEYFNVTQTYSNNQNMCPFLGKNLLGRVMKVYVRGKTVYNQGKFKPLGQRVTRPL